MVGDPDYATYLPIYDFLWVFTKIKMCTSGINHTSNGCYYVVMNILAIFFLRQGRDEPTKAYYRRFEASISTTELSKCTAKTHVDLNKTYVGGDYHNGTNRFQLMCLLMLDNSEQYSGMWNELKNSTFLVMDN